MKESQLLKGILDGCVLSIIAEGETYGYELILRLSEHGFKEIQDGTLYPILNRMEKKGYLNCRQGKSSLGPKRKYYSLSPSGKDFLEDYRKTYVDLIYKANSLILNKK